jgi:hypothetical protein
MRIAVVNSCCVPPSAAAKTTLDTVFGNTGNAVIYSGLESLLPSRPSLVLPSIFSFRRTAYLSDGSKIEELSSIAHEISNCDITVLILQDLARKDAYVTAAQLDDAKKLLRNSRNLFVFSLGANSLEFNRNDLAGTAGIIAKALPDFILDFLRFLLDKSLLVSVRGQVTADVLGLVCPSPSARISIDGCPSLSGRHLDYQSTQKNISRVNWARKPSYVTGGLFGLRRRRTLLRVFHVAQEKSELNPLFNHILSPEFGGESMLLSAMCTKKLFLKPQRWNTWLRRLAHSRTPLFYCGTRVHGMIQALVSGIPGVLLSGDSRALEMASLYGIPLVLGACLEDVPDIVANHDYSDLFDRQSILSRRLHDSISLMSAC